MHLDSSLQMQKSYRDISNMKINCWSATNNDFPFKYYHGYMTCSNPRLWTGCPLLAGEHSRLRLSFQKVYKVFKQSDKLGVISRFTSLWSTPDYSATVFGIISRCNTTENRSRPWWNTEMERWEYLNTENQECNIYGFLLLENRPVTLDPF